MTSLGTLDSQVTGGSIAESWRLEQHARVDIDGRADLGQFLTPQPVAAQMVRMFGPMPRAVHLLDAGAGAGALIGAFVATACEATKRPDSIHVTAFEIDGRLHPALASTLAACALECRQRGIKFTAVVRPENFVLEATSGFWRSQLSALPINRAILNPPYVKLGARSPERQALRTIGLETGNLYSAFVGLALELLADAGELVAITPRSFCNGPYFEPFRHWVLERAAILNAHVYDSRRSAFSDDAVLQENVIFRLKRGFEQPKTVLLGTSEGPAQPVKERRIPSTELIRPDDPRKFIRLVHSREGTELGEKISRLPSTLTMLGLTVSTGRVVDFRVRDALQQTPTRESAPLIYPAHFSGRSISWPKEGSRKPNAIRLNEATAPLLVRAGHYVLTKRFSSKEEARRIVAVTITPSDVPGASYAFENHLNYFHADGEGLSRTLALGLAMFLNSKAVDDYFRQFSGHTQVNATDLRSLRYPSREQLESLGSSAEAQATDQQTIDSRVEQTLWSTSD